MRFERWTTITFTTGGKYSLNMSPGGRGGGGYLL